jgi:hypothetical protein
MFAGASARAGAAVLFVEDPTRPLVELAWPAEQPANSAIRPGTASHRIIKNPVSPRASTG